MRFPVSGLWTVRILGIFVFDCKFQRSISIDRTETSFCFAKKNPTAKDLFVIRLDQTEQHL